MQIHVLIHLKKSHGIHIEKDIPLAMDLRVFNEYGRIVIGMIGRKRGLWIRNKIFDEDAVENTIKKPQIRSIPYEAQYLGLNEICDTTITKTSMNLSYKLVYIYNRYRRSLFDNFLRFNFPF